MNTLEPPARPAKTIAASSPRGPRILVVEDHADTRRSLEMLLDLMGYRVIAAGDLKTALDAVADGERFDLLLSDLGLPDGSGWDLLRALETSGRCPAQAVAMSGLCGFADKAESRAAGFRAHLVKPFSPEALDATLKALAAETAAG